MEKMIRINNQSFVAKSAATRLLGYSNHNSIDNLIRQGKLQEFKIQGLGKSLISFDEIKAHPRFSHNSAKTTNYP